MSANQKAKSSDQARDLTDAGAEQTKEFMHKAGSATTQAASTMQTCCSTALKGMQQYSQKLFEFARDNGQAHFDFMQNLAAVKEPREFFEMSAEHTKRQMAKLAEQTKELATLAQRIAVAATEPVKEGLLAKYNEAA
jgi:phasin